MSDDVVLRGDYKQELEQQADKMIPTWESLLPPHIPIQRFKRTVLTAVLMNPKLLSADRRSLWNSSVRAATDGLLPDGREAIFTSFKTKKGGSVVQYMPMYAGLLKKVRNSGQLASIYAEVVYEKDKFRYTRGDDNRIEHEPDILSDDPGKVIAVYAIAVLKSGESVHDVMPRRDIDKRAAMSRAQYDDSPWEKWYDEMAKKTVLRRISKILPVSTDRDGYISAESGAVHESTFDEEKPIAIEEDHITPELPKIEDNSESPQNEEFAAFLPDEQISDEEAAEIIRQHKITLGETVDDEPAETAQKSESAVPVTWETGSLGKIGLAKYRLIRISPNEESRYFDFPEWCEALRLLLNEEPNPYALWEKNMPGIEYFMKNRTDDESVARINDLQRHLKSCLVSREQEKTS